MVDRKYYSNEANIRMAVALAVRGRNVAFIAEPHTISQLFAVTLKIIKDELWLDYSVSHTQKIVKFIDSNGKLSLSSTESELRGQRFDIAILEERSAVSATTWDYTLTRVKHKKS